jgi:peptide/nickel transport system permease protein
MNAYLTRRALLVIPTLIGASLIVFTVMHVIPGDPAAVIATNGGLATASESEIDAVRQKLGLGEPLPVQYVRWVGGLVTLNAGTSLWTGTPVLRDLVARVPVTLELALIAVVLSWCIGIPLGVLSAVFRNTWIDNVARLLSVAGLAVPNFWLGVLIILLLSTYFRWIPPLGYAELHVDPAKNLQQIIWPALALSYRLSAILSRLTRAGLIEVLEEDYIRTARAKGLSLVTVLRRHALRNALLPVVTVTGLQLGTLLAGAVVMETIFSLPGMGRLLVDSINHRDFPVIQTALVFVALIVAAVNLGVDLLYTWINPRIRYS